MGTIRPPGGLVGSEGWDRPYTPNPSSCIPAISSAPFIPLSPCSMHYLDGINPRPQSPPTRPFPWHIASPKTQPRSLFLNRQLQDAAREGLQDAAPELFPIFLLSVMLPLTVSYALAKH